MPNTFEVAHGPALTRATGYPFPGGLQYDHVTRLKKCKGPGIVSTGPQKLCRSVFENAGVAIAMVDEDGTLAWATTTGACGQKRKWVKVLRSILR